LDDAQFFLGRFFFRRTALRRAGGRRTSCWKGTQALGAGGVQRDHIGLRHSTKNSKGWAARDSRDFGRGPAAFDAGEARREAGETGTRTQGRANGIQGEIVKRVGPAPVLSDCRDNTGGGAENTGICSASRHPRSAVKPGGRDTPLRAGQNSLARNNQSPAGRPRPHVHIYGGSYILRRKGQGWEPTKRTAGTLRARPHPHPPTAPGAAEF